MSWEEYYAPDEEGFFDISCKGKDCGGTDFIIQANKDGKTLKIICFKCKREVAFEVEPYIDPPNNSLGFLTNHKKDDENEDM